MGICCRKSKIEIELLTDVDMILYYEHGIWARISRAICNYNKANNKYFYDYDKRKIHPLSILILTINTYGLYQYHFLMPDSILLRKYQYLHMISL